MIQSRLFKPTEKTLAFFEFGSKPVQNFSDGKSLFT